MRTFHYHLTDMTCAGSQNGQPATDGLSIKFTMAHLLQDQDTIAGLREVRKTDVTASPHYALVPVHGDRSRIRRKH